MSAFETLRPIMEKYIVEPDSLQTAFDEPTTDLFSLGMDSLRRFYAVLCSCVYPCQRTSVSVKRRGSSLPFTPTFNTPHIIPNPDP